MARLFWMKFASWSSFARHLYYQVSAEINH